MTKETERVFKILYCEYKRRRKSGSSKATAMEFEDGSIGRIIAFKNWMPEDIRYALRELRSAGYIQIDILGNVKLCEQGLEYMESKPKEFFAELGGLFDLVGLFGSLIPPI